MAGHKQRDWRELCTAVTSEPDSTKLDSLVLELIRALDEGEREWRHAISPPNTIAANRKVAEEVLDSPETLQIHGPSTWCPFDVGQFLRVVSASAQIRYYRVESVEWVKWIEKKERFVYSKDSGKSLKRKALPKLRGSNPFFGTKIA